MNTDLRIFALMPFSLLLSFSAVAEELEEVVVTSQRRAENVQTVPASVTAVTAGTLRELGWERLTELPSQVPNLNASAPYGDALPIFSIRGVSMLDYSPSQTSPIGVYIDEGYLAPTFAHGLGLFDLERVEVLRGPQGTLYGKSATGGAINLITKTPGVSAPPSAFFEFGVGNFGMTRLETAAESALIDGHLGGRIAIRHQQDSGYWENAGGPNMAQTHLTSGRLSLNFKPSPRLSAVLKVNVAKNEGRAVPPRITATAGPGITVAGRPSNTARHSGAINRIGDTAIDLTIASLALSYDWRNFELVSISNIVTGEYHQVTDPDGTTASLLGVDWGADSKAFAQDFRLLSNSEQPVRFIVGLYFDKEDTDTRIVHREMFADSAVNPTLSALGLGAAPIDMDLSNHLLVLADALPLFGQVDRRFDVERRTAAVYGNLDADLGERLQIGVGLRYSEVTNSRDYVNYSRLDGAGNGIGSWLPGNILTPQFNALGIDAPFVTYTLSQSVPIPAGTYLDGSYTLDSGEVRERSEGEWSGTMSVSYDLGNGHMLWGRYARGYRSGSFNNGLVYSDQPDDNGAYARPEFVDAFELGFKGGFLDQRIRVTAAVFQYDYDDQQFVNQIGISAQLANAGAARIRGGEIELSAVPLDNLTVDVGVGLLDTEYDELELPQLSTPLDPVDTINLSGNELVSAPSTNVNYRFSYELAAPADWRTRLHLSGAYVGDQWFSAYNGLDGHDDIRADSYFVHDARITFFSPGDRLVISGWVKNLADEEYDVFAINLQSGFGYNYFLEGRPRTWGADFSLRFD